MKELILSANKTVRLIPLSKLDDVFTFKGYKEKIRWQNDWRYIKENEIFNQNVIFTRKDICFLICLVLSDPSRAGGIRYIELKTSIYNSLWNWETHNQDSIYLKRVVITRKGKRLEDTVYKAVVYSGHHTELDFYYLFNDYPLVEKYLHDQYTIDMDWQEVYNAYIQYQGEN